MNSRNLSLEESIEYINSINFEPIIDKLINHMGWNEHHAHEVCQMYRNFLFLKKKYGDEFALPPSEDIDEFWHMHILDTKLYRKDCEALFGHYLDHYPYLGIDATTNFADLEKAFDKTVELYRIEFNKDIVEVRGSICKLISYIKTLFIKKPKRAVTHNHGPNI